MRKYKISMTHEKCLILHLMDYIDFKTKLEVTEAISQPGIANVLGLRLEHVSRLLINPIKKGLVYSRTTYVKGFPRRKKTYYLTKKGISYANEIEKWLNDKLFLFIL